jgi:hypothetical protein
MRYVEQKQRPEIWNFRSHKSKKMIAIKLTPFS